MCLSGDVSTMSEEQLRERDALMTAAGATSPYNAALIEPAKTAYTAEIKQFDAIHQQAAVADAQYAELQQQQQQEIARQQALLAEQQARAEREAAAQAQAALAAAPGQTIKQSAYTVRSGGNDMQAVATEAVEATKPKRSTLTIAPAGPESTGGTGLNIGV
jgi:nucleoid-associated protein YgaU